MKNWTNLSPLNHDEHSHLRYSRWKHSVMQNKTNANTALNTSSQRDRERLCVYGVTAKWACTLSKMYHWLAEKVTATSVLLSLASLCVCKSLCNRVALAEIGSGKGKKWKLSILHYPRAGVTDRNSLSFKQTHIIVNVIIVRICAHVRPIFVSNLIFA